MVQNGNLLEMSVTAVIAPATSADTPKPNSNRAPTRLGDSG